MGLNTLTYLKNHQDIYQKLEALATRLEKGFNDNIKKTGVKAKMVRFGGMSALFFTDREITDFA
ncbi:MAG: aspartate aminotransferase family protein, partial [Eubacterium sp.]